MGTAAVGHFRPGVFHQHGQEIVPADFRRRFGKRGQPPLQFGADDRAGNFLEQRQGYPASQGMAGNGVEQGNNFRPDPAGGHFRLFQDGLGQIPAVKWIQPGQRVGGRGEGYPTFRRVAGCQQSVAGSRRRGRRQEIIQFGLFCCGQQTRRTRRKPGQVFHAIPDKQGGIFLQVFHYPLPLLRAVQIGKGQAGDGGADFMHYPFQAGGMGRLEDGVKDAAGQFFAPGFLQPAGQA